ncbi:hypothetical protein IWQ57_003657 [Coemansia nantahalensis]|uniref:Uncharacterized protein n=1 Tax=Coemansia nantahalensis TaxID=2789366 RepID=A0ACC1JVK6_9FUNG|nr:hypothetical protein IWQ57_003657 [Coemansia nantahalensis]
MPRHRDRMVRRAVARHIIQQVRSQRCATASGGWLPGAHPAPADAVSAAAAAVAALVAGMSAAQADARTGAHHTPRPAGSDAERELIQRIIELQREKEQLLRIVQRSS